MQGLCEEMLPVEWQKGKVAGFKDKGCIVWWHGAMSSLRTAVTSKAEEGEEESSPGKERNGLCDLGGGTTLYLTI